MKTLMPVLHYYPVIGGLETWTQNIAERLTPQAEIYVVTGKVKNQPQAEIKNGVKIYRTSPFSLKNLSYSSPIYIFSTLPFLFFHSLNLIKKAKIDLLHCQGFLSGLVGYFLFKLTRVPYIITVQKIEENSGFLKRLVYKNAKTCIAASSAIKKYFEKIGCQNIEIIPNGIDLTRFQNLDRQNSREKLGLKDELVIMTVARLEKVKGIEFLIKSAHLFNTKYQLPNNKYLIIGDGSERKNLENLAEKLNLKEKVKFLGQIPNEKAPAYLAAADCFVLPSIKEGFGISILEAQAAGVPVIATEVGGILDIIENGKSGVLVEPQNPEAIAEAIFNFFSDPELTKNLIENAKTKLKKYDWINITQKVFKIYDDLLSKKELLLKVEILIHPHDYKKKKDWKKIFEFLDENLDYQEIKNFLDLGAGMGNTAFHILKRNPNGQAVCLDINQNYLDICQKRHPKIDILLHDVNQKLPFNDKAFDLVSCIGVLHSRSIINVDRVLADTIRVSRKYLLVDFFLKSSPYVFLEKIRHPKYAPWRWNKGELQRLFSKLNLKVVAKMGTRTIFPKAFPFSGKTVIFLLKK